MSSAVLLGLSFWQLNKGFDQIRAKQGQLSVNNANQAKTLSMTEATAFWAADPTSINDSLTTVQGQINEDTVVLHDNRILNSRPGYGVYMPLKLTNPVKALPFANLDPQNPQKQTLSNSNYTHILVNLGWHPIVNFNRQTPPSVSLKLPRNDTSVINVTLEHINDNVFTLDTLGLQEMSFKTPPEGANTLTDKKQTSPQQNRQKVYRVQKIQLSELSQQLNIQLMPFVARATLSLTEPALPSLSLPIAKRGISAEKHFGYSAQWFIFWCIAVGVFLYTQCSWYANGRLKSD